jgi:hypothetical protein
MKRLTTEGVSGLPDIPTMEYEIKEWGVSLLLQGISKKMQIELGRIVNDEETDAFSYQKELLKACVVEPVLNDDLIDELYEKDNKVIDQIFLAINDLNGIGDSDNESVIEEFQDE